MSRWYDKFGVLGLSASDVEGRYIQCYCVVVTVTIVTVVCITALSCFALKTHELLLYVSCLIKNCYQHVFKG